MDSWETLPGSNATGDDIDSEYLANWIREAREGLTREGRLTVGDITLGQLFAHAPAGADGTWPHPAVREVIETKQSHHIESGFRTGIFNSRGFVSKHYNEGGEQERVLADRYQEFAEAVQGSAPRTAA